MRVGEIPLAQIVSLNHTEDFFKRQMNKYRKRFRFDKETDIALVNAVRLSEAHVAKNEEVNEKFNVHSISVALRMQLYLK